MFKQPHVFDMRSLDARRAEAKEIARDAQKRIHDLGATDVDVSMTWHKEDAPTPPLPASSAPTVKFDVRVAAKDAPATPSGMPSVDTLAIVVAQALDDRKANADSRPKSYAVADAALALFSPVLATLRAENERLAKERDAYRKAKQENDERFMAERDSARRERDRMHREWEKVCAVPSAERGETLTGQELHGMFEHSTGWSTTMSQSMRELYNDAAKKVNAHFRRPSPSAPIRVPVLRISESSRSEMDPEWVAGFDYLREDVVQVLTEAGIEVTNADGAPLDRARRAPSAPMRSVTPGLLEAADALRKHVGPRKLDMYDKDDRKPLEVYDAARAAYARLGAPKAERGRPFDRDKIARALEDARQKNQGRIFDAGNPFGMEWANHYADAVVNALSASATETEPASPGCARAVTADEAQELYKALRRTDSWQELADVLNARLSLPVAARSGDA